MCSEFSHVLHDFLLCSHICISFSGETFYWGNRLLMLKEYLKKGSRLVKNYGTYCVFSSVYKQAASKDSKGTLAKEADSPQISHWKQKRKLVPLVHLYNRPIFFFFIPFEVLSCPQNTWAVWHVGHLCWNVLRNNSSDYQRINVESVKSCLLNSFICLVMINRLGHTGYCMPNTCRIQCLLPFIGYPYSDTVLAL